MMRLAEIAARLGGKLHGDGSAEIRGLASAHSAVAGDITFLTSSRYAKALGGTRASAAIVSEDWTGDCPCAVVRVADVNRACMAVAGWFAPPAPVFEPGVHRTAIVAAGVVLGKDVSIGPYCVLEPEVRVGDRTVVGAGSYIGHGTSIGVDGKLYPNVTVREGTRIGDRAIIHSGTVIGSDGYGFIPEQKDGKLVVTKIPQVGTVEIGNDVEIGANVAIDRARFGRTRIGNSVKIDNLVQIAHNVEIGDFCGIVAQVGIAGSTTVGSRVIMWGQAGVAGHVHVGDGAVVGAQAGVTKDVAPGTFVVGFPAQPHDKAALGYANVSRIPQLKQRVAELDARIASLEKAAAKAGTRGKAARRAAGRPKRGRGGRVSR